MLKVHTILLYVSCKDTFVQRVRRVLNNYKRGRVPENFEGALPGRTKNSCFIVMAAEVLKKGPRVGDHVTLPHEQLTAFTCCSDFKVPPVLPGNPREMRFSVIVKATKVTILPPKQE